MRKRSTKLLTFILACCITLLTTAPAVAANELTLNCKSAILIDGGSGTVLFEQNSDTSCYPASVTKIMTMVLILEAVENERISLDDQVSVSEAAASMGGSQVFLYPGEVRTVDEMLIAIAVGSGNDAAYAMAEFVGGTYDAFITMMNDKAGELGMNNTHFVNPHGLHDPEHYTTAADLGKLAYHALHIPKFLDYTSIYEYEFRTDPLLTLWNTNRLLKWYDGADGMKTGFTSEAGRNLVATAERDGLRLISVVLGCEESKSHFTRSMELLNYGFNKYQQVSIHSAGETITHIPVSKGAEEKITAVLAEDISYAAMKGTENDINEILNVPDSIAAPVSKGDTVGTLTIYLDGKEWKTLDLIAAEDIERGGLLRSWKKLWQQIW